MSLTKKLLKRLGTIKKVDRLERKAKTITRINACKENGKIAVVESGIDCDGVCYNGIVTIIPATYTHFENLHDSTAKGADGPFNLEIHKPSEEIEYKSEDRTLQAFENGHPHLIVY